MASEYLQWKYRDVKPDEKKTYTKQEKRKNWWHYHKWGLLAGLLLAAALADILLNALGVGKTEPDYQAAYIASVPLEDEQIRQLEAALAALGEDCNGDGRVLVRVNSYVDMATSGDSDAAGYAAAAKVRLMADLESCESYFFLCADPDRVQEDFQILAGKDGTLAGQGEAPQTFAWEELPPARGKAPSLPGVRLARRGFWEDRTCRFREACDSLWEKLTEEAEP